MNASVLALNQQIEELTQQIEAESRRMALHTQTKHEESQRRLDKARTAVEAIQTRLDELISKRKTASVQLDKLGADGKEADRAKAKLQEQITNCDRMINSAHEKEKDALIPYGRNMKELLQRIKSMRWNGDVPLGPLGQFVTAKDPKRWGEILRNQLGGYLTAFAITDAKDRNQLKKLLQDSGK